LFSGSRLSCHIISFLFSPFSPGFPRQMRQFCFLDKAAIVVVVVMAP